MWPYLPVPASALAEANITVVPLCSARVRFPHHAQPGMDERKPKAAGKFIWHLARSWIW